MLFPTRTDFISTSSIIHGLLRTLMLAYPVTQVVSLMLATVTYGLMNRASYRVAYRIETYFFSLVQKGKVYSSWIVYVSFQYVSSCHSEKSRP